MQQCLQLTSKEDFANLGRASIAPSVASHVQCLFPVSVLNSYLLSLAHSVPLTLASLFFQLPGHFLLLYPVSEMLFPQISSRFTPLPSPPLCSNAISSEKPSLITLPQIALPYSLLTLLCSIVLQSTYHHPL